MGIVFRTMSCEAEGKVKHQQEKTKTKEETQHTALWKPVKPEDGKMEIKKE